MLQLAGIGLCGLGLTGLPSLARAATVADYLQDGWELQGFSNNTVAQVILRKKDRAILCTFSAGSVLECADFSRWRVNESK
jgi:hypothetical protein